MIGVCVLAVALLSGVLAMRWYAGQKAGAGLFRTASLGAERPSDVGVPFSEVSLASGDRTLYGWLVRGPDTSTVGRAVLVFHGNGSSLSDQVGVLQVLYQNGFTAFAFDYSGYGQSSGEPSVSRLRRDAIAAFRVFSDSVGVTSRKFVLGTGLGAAVLLSALDEVQPVVDGVVLVGTFASGLEMAIRRGRVPPFLAFLLPDPYDNVRAISSLRKPLLVVHGTSDEVFPVDDAARLLEAAQGPKAMVNPEGVAHAEYLARSADWLPVLEFLRSR
jgi:fermentation-respiration switch protein FrsA (DUF1100 family)